MLSYGELRSFWPMKIHPSNVALAPLCSEGPLGNPGWGLGVRNPQIPKMGARNKPGDKQTLVLPPICKKYRRVLLALRAQFGGQRGVMGLHYREERQIWSLPLGSLTWKQKMVSLAPLT